MNFITAFNKAKEKLVAADVAKLNGSYAIQVTMSDEDCGGTFYVQAANGALNVEPYDYNDNDLAVVIKRADLMKLVGRRSSLETVIKNNAIELYGNADVLADVINSIPKAAPAKKAPAKKVEKTEAVKAEPAKKVEKKAEAVKAEPAKKAEKKAAAPKAEAKKTAEKKTTKK